jgi:hypothetical protein
LNAVKRTCLFNIAHSLRNYGHGLGAARTGSRSRTREPERRAGILSAFAISDAPTPCAFVARTWAASIEAGQPF